MSVDLVDPEPDPRAHIKEQPSLFNQKQFKPRDEDRYQRGYTPERMREVKSLPVDIHTESALVAKKAVPGTNIKPGQRIEGPLQGGRGRARIQQTIARSTTPLDELRTPPGNTFGARILGIPRAPGSRLQISSQKLIPAAGSYGSERGQDLGEYGQVSLHPFGGGGIPRTKAQEQSAAESGSQTLMHELGHVRSHVETNRHSWPLSPEDVGKEEAFADENMVERWRPDPRDVRRGVSRPHQTPYEEKGSFLPYAGHFQEMGDERSALDIDAAARRSYKKARTTPLLSAPQKRQPKPPVEVQQQMKFPAKPAARKSTPARRPAPKKGRR